MNPRSFIQKRIIMHKSHKCYTSKLIVILVIHLMRNFMLILKIKFNYSSVEPAGLSGYRKVN